MSERISESDLTSAAGVINSILRLPSTYSTDGRTNVGHYRIDTAYGGYKLVQTTSEGGSRSDISPLGYTTRRNLYTYLRGFIDGIQAAQKYPTKGELPT